MFRPAPHTAVLYGVPIRLIASILFILALMVSVLLIFGLEHEKAVLEGLTEGKTIPSEIFPALWQSRRDFIVLTGLLFLVSAVATAAVATSLHYQSTRRTLEEVKGLARNILQSIPTGILTVNGIGMITAVNPAAELILRRSSAELLGKTYESAFVEQDAFRVALASALRARQYVDHHDLPREDGKGARRTIRLSTAELPGDDDGPAGAILLAKDVTDWLALEQRVRTADKLSALHTLSAGVAHELRNPLSAVDLNLHLLEDELRESRVSSRKASEYLRVLNAECRRLSVILDNFMKFARPGALQVQPVDMAGLIEQIVSLLHYEAEAQRIAIEVTVPNGMTPVIGDSTQISQVLVNILVNAFQAMPDGGTCRIAAQMTEREGTDWCDLTVQDSGQGIKDVDLPRLFEPFYTTKAAGTGLGLAVAYRIVQDHGGTIDVASTPGHGTSVTVRFPVAGKQETRTMVAR
jgi:PAS domain S-box-containing protein